MPRAQYTDLRRILAECATEHGATLRYGAEQQVKSVSAHATRPSVTLASGEVLSADVVVGADGHLINGPLTRRAVAEAIEQEVEEEVTGMVVYQCVCALFRCAATGLTRACLCVGEMHDAGGKAG